jgi:hypothetical protein
MGLTFQVLQLSDIDEILDYEQKKLGEMKLPETEMMFRAWQARWR